jgi:hypothetical protein
MVNEFVELAYAAILSFVHRARARLARALQHLSYLHCSLLRGHDESLQFQQNRLFLRCISCGYETPGWSLDRSMPVVHVPAARRSAFAPRVSARRIA